MPSELARLTEVRRVGRERVDELAQTVTAAFADDPFGIYMASGSPDYDALRMWTYALAHADRGTELLADETSMAVAVWEPPIGSVPEQPNRDPGGYMRLLTEMVGEARAVELITFIRSMHETRPAQPHWYLSIIGVHPDAQNRGWGSELLAPMLRRCDTQGLACYLESSNPRNHSFYLRHGFTQVGSLAAPDGPELARFLRDAPT